MSASHNSFNSSSDDSMPHRINSMLHETFDEDHVQLYEYLVQEEEESLPELASVTTNSIASSSRIVSLDESPVVKGRRREFSGLPRRRQHLFSSPTTSHKKRESGIHSSSPLSPYLKRSDENDTKLQQQQIVSLKRQLQQAQQDLATERLSHEKVLEREQHEYQQRFQEIQEQHELELQLHNDYQSTLVEKLRQRDEELEAKEMEMDELRQLLFQHQEQGIKQEAEQNESFTTGYESEDEQDSLEQRHVRGNSSNSVELNEMIDECQRELQEFGAELGLEQQEHVNMPSVPREISTTRQVEQDHYEQEHPYSSSMMVSSSVDLAQSLVRMLEEESLSNEEENAIWEKLATLSEHLGKQDFYQYEYNQQDAVVPLEVYQQMESKCDILEHERTLLKEEFLQVVHSTRTAHALQLQIMISEIREEAQRQVTSVLNGKQEGLVFDHAASRNT